MKHPKLPKDWGKIDGRVFDPEADRRRILRVLRPFKYKRPWTRGWNKQVQAHFDGVARLYRELGGK